jgi:hypothetical protein
LTQFGLAVAALAVVTVLSPGMSATRAQAQNLVPGADCSRLLASEQTECIRTMRRLELRRMEEPGSATTVPAPSGGAIGQDKVPDVPTAAPHLVPQNSGMAVPSGAAGGRIGK